MIEKKYLKETVGIIKDIFIPRLYDEEIKDFLLNSEIDIIGFVIQEKDNTEIKVIVDKNEETNSLFVNDKVVIETYETLYDYKNYRKKLYEKLYLENSYLTEYEIKKIFYNTVISEEQFKKKPVYINEYIISNLNNLFLTNK